MSIKDTMVEALHSADSGRARSQQKEVGPSSLGGCRRQVWHEIQGTPEVNHGTLRLAAIMGTAIHDAIQQAFTRLDPWGERYRLEEEVEADGLVGHVDLYDIQEQAVVDWKTTTKKNMGYFPADRQWWQVQVYGMLMEANGYPVKTVTLVAVVRDGNEDDVVEVSQPYDPEAARSAVAWLEEVRGSLDPPAPERAPRPFCAPYCGFYDPTAPVDSVSGCPGKRGRAS